MLDNFKGSLRILSSLVVFGFQLVIPQASIEHRKVPQRIKDRNVAPEDESGGIPGVWGSWGPWSACSRSCSGGVMVQMRPCLPGYYYERTSHKPGQFSASERALAHIQQPPQEDSLPPFSGHVISAIRTSVPLHRNEEPPRAALSSGGGRNDSHWSRATSRGSEVPQSRRRSPKSERRGRNKSPIGPGKYGYGKVPYILPLQTDTGQSTHKPRKQRQSMQPAPNQQGTGGISTFAHPDSPSHHHPGGTYQGDHQSSPARSQVASSSFYQQPGSHFQSFPAASQSLFQGTERGRHLPGASYPPVQGQMSAQPAAAIVCTGAYKQYRLCNTNACLENRNIREVQCASYNNKPFMGRFYEWEPFAEVKGSQKCELNCRAVGYRFYVRQAEKVIDGTPCDQNGTSVCVSGQCKFSLRCSFA
ncbi:thrombospondin type-1 domain-containing protein 4 [Crotalus adamanteus]|uniref:Thrombospondin type-1 domain-containing protein 4 n=1 Tax=Crotalus adamanteus TaxID=8729 RepID=A0AAW1AWG2_CROAD